VVIPSSRATVLAPESSDVLETLGIAGRLMASRSDGRLWAPADLEYRADAGHFGLPDESAAWFFERSVDEIAAATTGIELAALELTLPPLLARVAALGPDADQRLFNGPRVSLVDGWTADLPAGPRLVLRVGPTNYYTFIVTNQALPTWAARGGLLPARLPVCGLANSLAATLCLITSDDRLIVSERSRFVSQYPGLLTVSASGGVEVDATGGGGLLHNALASEAFEELGIEVDPEECGLYGLAVNLDQLQVIAVGETRTALSSDRVLDRRGVDAALETAVVHAVSLTREDLPTTVAWFVETAARWEAASAVAFLACLERRHPAGDIRALTHALLARSA